MITFSELEYIRDKEKLKSLVATDILCGLGFCICDKNDPYRRCLNFHAKREDIIFFDPRIPKRYRTSKFITKRQVKS